MKCTICGKLTSNPKCCSRLCSAKMKNTRDWKDWCDKVDKHERFLPTRNTVRQKRFLIQARGHKCELCGRKTWLRKPIDLVFDHINGNSNDWRLSNCRLICNNCDAQLPTYKGRNQGNGRHARKERYQQGKSY